MTILGRNCLRNVEKWGLPLKPMRNCIRTANGAQCKAVGYVEVPFEYRGRKRVIPTLLIEEVTKELILGTDFWNAFRIAPMACDVTDVDVPKLEVLQEVHNLSPNQAERLNRVVRKFPFAKLSGTLSCTSKTQHKIDTGDAKPIRQKQYVMSPYVQDDVNKEIERMLERGIIERVSHPEWLNPVIAVRKPNGKIRLCIDARKLNQVTIKNAYPQQNVNRILGRLRGTKFLTALDLSDAFYQVELAEESRPKTAFSVASMGTFMYKRMPMGLCNSGATLCELIDRLFGVELEPDAFPYLDDFIIATDTFEEHVRVLELVATRLREAGLTISAEKSKFCMKRLKYLGHIMDETGIRPDFEKIQPIVEYPIPKSVRDVRRLLGMVGWYRRFIRDFSTITAPISELLKKSKLKFE